LCYARPTTPLSIASKPSTSRFSNISSVCDPDSARPTSCPQVADMLFSWISWSSSRQLLRNDCCTSASVRAVWKRWDCVWPDTNRTGVLVVERGDAAAHPKHHIIHLSIRDSRRLDHEVDERQRLGHFRVFQSKVHRPEH